MRRCDAQGIRIATDFLQRRQNENFVVGPTSKAIGKAHGQGRNSTTKRAAHKDGRRLSRIGSQYFNVIGFRAVEGSVFQKGRQFFGLFQTVMRHGCIVEPAVWVRGEKGVAGMRWDEMEGGLCTRKHIGSLDQRHHHHTILPPSLIMMTSIPQATHARKQARTCLIFHSTTSTARTR